MHSGEAAAIIESIVSNARHALGDGDGGEAVAIIESMVSNARHAIGLTIIGDCRGYSNCSAVFVGVSAITISSIRHRHRQVLSRGDVVVDAIYLKILCTSREAAKEQRCGEQNVFGLFHVGYVLSLCLYWLRR